MLFNKIIAGRENLNQKALRYENYDKSSNMNQSILLFIILNVGMSLQSLAQKQGQSRIDSLQALLPIAKEDTSKVNLLNDLSFTFYSINPDEGIYYGKQGLELAEKLNWKKGMARANNVIGVNYGFGKSDYPDLLKYDLISLKIYEELEDKIGIAGNLNDIALVYIYFFEYFVFPLFSEDFVLL